MDRVRVKVNCFVKVTMYSSKQPAAERFNLLPNDVLAFSPAEVSRLDFEPVSRSSVKILNDVPQVQEP